MHRAADIPRAPELPEQLDAGEIDSLAHDELLSDIELTDAQLAAGHANGVTFNTARLLRVDLSEARLEQLGISDGVLNGCVLANLHARGAYS